MFTFRLAGGHLYGKRLTVAGDVFDGVLFCTISFPTRCCG